jgi:hypothetical protein
MKSGDTRRYSHGHGHPLGLTQSHLSVEAAPYVRNPSPAEAAAISEAGEVDEKGITPATSADEEGKAPEYVEPGWKGWMNVVGSVVINMTCCELSSPAHR